MNRPKMKIPKSIVFQGIEYTTKFGKSSNEMNRLNGHIDHKKALIEIDAFSLGHQMQCLTYLRELMHLVYENSNILFEENEDETIIDQLTKGIYAILQDNIKEFYDIKVTK